MNETLRETYGYAFQIKLMGILMFDKPFLQRIVDTMRPQYFDSESLQWYFKTLHDYYEKYRTNITFDALASIAKEEIVSDALFEEVKKTAQEITNARDADDLDYVKEKSIEFCQNQEIRNAVEDIIDEMQSRKNGDLRETVRVRIDKALKAGADTNIGHIYKSEDAISERMSDAFRSAVPTPWNVVNELTDGGAGSGDLFIIMAPPGIGKSWALQNIGAHAIKSGKTVIHYTMELGEHYVGRRYDSYFTGHASQNLKYHKEDVEQSVRHIDGNLIVKYYPPKVASINMIRAHMDKCIIQGYKPDLVIVDYADLMRSLVGNSRSEVRHLLENIYEELRGTAGEYGIPFWSATQANRSSLEQDIISAENVSEAFNKIMVADFIMSLSRKVNDKIAGTGRWFIVKNRLGPDGITLPSKINTSNGQILIYEQSSVEGASAKKDMEKGNLAVRKQLGQKHRELMRDEQRGTASSATIHALPLPSLDGFEEDVDEETGEHA